MSGLWYWYVQMFGDMCILRVTKCKEADKDDVDGVSCRYMVEVNCNLC